MSRDKDRKRIIRSRMKKTGETYTTARAHLFSTSKVPPPPAVDYAALAGTRDEVIAAKTGRTWEEWVRLLDRDQAATMAHRDIARLVHEEHGVGAWWSQSVTVGYEQIKGLRVRGQRRDGAYEAGRSRTFGVAVERLFHAWADDASRREWLRHVDATVRTATRPKTVRLQWPDGTIVIAGLTAKGPAKSAVAVLHTKLVDKAAADRAEQAWTERLDGLGASLGVPHGRQLGVGTAEARAVRAVGGRSPARWFRDRPRAGSPKSRVTPWLS